VKADPFNRIADEELALSRQFLTTELHVAEAISRLLAREHETVAALNLSLGAYAVDPTRDQVFLALEKALQAWSDAYPASPVFAAAGNEAGNEEDPGPFWPATLPSVRGIAAADLKGEEVVWDQQGNLVMPAMAGIRALEGTAKISEHMVERRESVSTELKVFTLHCDPELEEEGLPRREHQLTGCSGQLAAPVIYLPSIDPGTR
jgi:hypothetical protein